jgi:hypothetical protein
MNRRDFLKVSGTALAGSSLVSCASARLPDPKPNADARTLLLAGFDQVLDGFLRNARTTSADYTACDLPGGTKLESCCTPNGKTFTSVARMLPAMADFVSARFESKSRGPDLEDVILSIYRTAFDPKHPDYWGEPKGDKPTQRTVEAALVAIALARMGPEFAAKLSTLERAQVNRWLASCTVIPERTNNHAWFTAVNQATRLRLGKLFPEFKGDEAWMLDDLKAIDALAAEAADGWYSDDPKFRVYDYYNFWTFGNFPLFWSRIAGEFYPEWNEKLRARGREFLQNTPYFFAEDGAVPLFGRSLLYKWSLLSPLLLGYEQGIWPHSPGLLQRIVRKNFGWWWQLGAYDAKLGKLRETLSPEGSREVSEPYIDNGHPYWAMLAFTFFSIPAKNPLWTAKEEKLPVEKGDYIVRISGPRMLLTGTKASGQVRWLQATNTPRRELYRDKYNKFVSCSSFPFNAIQHGKGMAWDQALVFQNTDSGECAGRVFPEAGELLEEGVQTIWSAKLATGVIRVISTIRLAGDFEFRSHAASFEPLGDLNDPASIRNHALKIAEGSYALGLAEGEKPQITHGPKWTAIRSQRSGKLLVSWAGSGFDGLEVLTKFPPDDEPRVNLVASRMALISVFKDTAVPLLTRFRLTSLHYASPKPLPMEAIQERGWELLARWA